MKKIIILITLFGLLSGCVSLKKYNELQRELSDIKQKNEVTDRDARLLKQKNEALTQELQQSRQTAEFFYRAGTEFYDQKQYDLAMDHFEKLLDRFPANSLVPQAREKIAEISAFSSSKAGKILKAAEGARDLHSRIDIINRGMNETYLTREDTDRLSKRRETYKLQDEANRHIIVEDDPTQSQRIYRTTRSTIQELNYDKSFYVEIYLIHRYSGRKDFRIKTRYIGDKWISYDSVSLRGENGTHAEIVCKYPEKLSNLIDERIYEWSDNDIEDDKVIKLAKTGVITVRFSGGYKYTFEMTDEQLTALKEIVRKYQTLR
jgi:tetratricopeptide (TPR) repeat protein